MQPARHIEHHCSLAADIDQAGAIAPGAHWARLLAMTTGAAAIFQSPEWIRAWTAHFLPPHAHAARVTCTEAGVVAAQAWFFRFAGDGRDRWLPVGAGNTDTLDPLIDSAHANCAAAALVNALRRLARTAPVELTQLTTQSPLARHARAAGLTVQTAEPCLAIDVQHGTGVDDVVRPALARNIAYARRRLQREGAWSIDDATPATRHAMLEQLFQLHASRWRARGQSGVLDDSAVRAFHHSVATALPPRTLVLRALRLNDHVVACYYGFRTADREIYYIGGFDPAYARLSPGIVLLAHAFEHARADGLQWLDLLRGRERYKYDWGAREQLHVTIRIP